MVAMNPKAMFVFFQVSPHFVSEAADMLLEWRLLFCSEGELTNKPQVNLLRSRINGQEGRLERSVQSVLPSAYDDMQPRDLY